MTKENRNNKKPNTTNDQRTAILVFLSQRHKDGRLCHGATQEAMVNFGVSGETIRRIWRLEREGVMDPTNSLDVSSKKKGKCGRKCKWGLGVVHAICGSTTGNEGYGAEVECYRCKPPENNTL